jgi:hypothetical protein
MNRKAITLFALAGFAGIAIGGSLFGLAGVAALFVAVWGITENGRMADWDHDIRNAYPVLMAQDRAAKTRGHRKHAPVLANVLS